MFCRQLRKIYHKERFLMSIIKKITTKMAICSLIFVFVLFALIKAGSRRVKSSLYDMTQAYNYTNIVPIAIIGSGPAGDAAAVYGARAHIPTLVIEGSKPGGLLMETSYVENLPGYRSILGRDYMDKVRDHAQVLGAEFLVDAVAEVNFSQWPFMLKTEEGKVLYALSVIIATGATPRRLGIAGEDDYWGFGVTSCAICDAPFFVGKDVVVIGGGDSAVEEAILLAPYVHTVTVLVRKDSMRAAPSSQEKLQGYSNIAVQYNIEVQKIYGDDEAVTGIEIFNNATQNTSTMDIQGVFLAVGHDPNTAIFKNFVSMDDHGYITMANRTQETSVHGVFAAGDVEDARYRQARVAEGHGISAALDAVNFLTSIGWNEESARRLEPQLFTLDHADDLVHVPVVSSTAAFDELLEKKDTLVVFDFYADFCPSCIHMLPHVEAMAQQYKDIVVAKVDVQAAADIGNRYHISRIPCLLAFYNKELVARYTGYMEKKELELFVAQLKEQTVPAIVRV
jgi:thioredoxin reductase (NADPH)